MISSVLLITTFLPSVFPSICGTYCAGIANLTNLEALDLRGNRINGSVTRLGKQL